MIHSALNSIPARPVLFIVPFVVLLALVFYYSNLRNGCENQVSHREYFIAQVKQAAESTRTLKLSDITRFPWQQVKGFKNFKPQHKTTSCPFGWGWSSADRKTIIDAGLLSVLIFFNQGEISNHIEFRGDQVLIEEFETALTPETAVFKTQPMESGAIESGGTVFQLQVIR